jgi:UDP-N-acetylglucosamine 2-epimerase (non-hydrolysing)
MKMLAVAGNPAQRLATVPVCNALGTEHDSMFVRVGRDAGGDRDAVGTALDAPESTIRLGAEPETPPRQTATLLQELDEIVAREPPAAVLVAGDTNATLAGALVGGKRDAVVAHVESGLRRPNRDGSNELERVLAEHRSGRLFVPSKRTRERLEAAGLTRGVHEVGDVACDALLAVRDRAHERSTVLETLAHEPGSFVLAAVHRSRSARDDRSGAILSGLADAPVPVVVPSHPRTASGLARRTGLPDGVTVVDTESYLDFLCLLDAADRVVTDAARVQKEAFYLDTPCVTVGETTPWIETVEAGWNVLVGTRPDAIARNLRRSFPGSRKPQLYGGGTAAERVVDALESAVATAASDERVGSAVP